jgi:hypothetical protein
MYKVQRNLFGSVIRPFRPDNESQESFIFPFQLRLDIRQNGRITKPALLTSNGRTRHNKKDLPLIHAAVDGLEHSDSEFRRVVVGLEFRNPASGLMMK